MQYSFTLPYKCNAYSIKTHLGFYSLLLDDIYFKGGTLSFSGLIIVYVSHPFQTNLYFEARLWNTGCLFTLNIFCRNTIPSTDWHCWQENPGYNYQSVVTTRSAEDCYQSWKEEFAHFCDKVQKEEYIWKTWLAGCLSIGKGGGYAKNNNVLQHDVWNCFSLQLLTSQNGQKCIPWNSRWFKILHCWYIPFNDLGCH